MWAVLRGSVEPGRFVITVEPGRFVTTWVHGIRMLAIHVTAILIRTQALLSKHKLFFESVHLRSNWGIQLHSEAATCRGSRGGSRRQIRGAACGKHRALALR